MAVKTCEEVMDGASYAGEGGKQVTRSSETGGSEGDFLDAVISAAGYVDNAATELYQYDCSDHLLDWLYKVCPQLKTVGNGIDKAVKKMIEAGQAPKKSRVVILGLTFKENCPDTRNSKVDDIIKQLNTYGIEPIIVDPWASERDAMHEYGVTLTNIEDVAYADCVIVAVAHNEFRTLSLEDIKKMFKDVPDGEKVLIDVKGLYKIEELKASMMFN